MSPQPAPPEIPIPDRIRDLCTWYGEIENEEKSYFARTQKCHAEAIEVERERGKLEAELREDPDPAKFRRLAEVRILARELRQLSTESVHSFFWQRRDYITRRSALYRDHREKLAELVTLTEAHISGTLAASQGRDAALTDSIGAKEPIVSKETRHLLAIRDAAGMVKAGLHDCNRLDGSDREESYWQPASGLVALISEELKK